MRPERSLKAFPHLFCVSPAGAEPGEGLDGGEGLQRMWVCLDGRESWGELESGLGISVLLLESREGSHCPLVTFSSQWPSYQRGVGVGARCVLPRVFWLLQGCGRWSRTLHTCPRVGKGEVGNGRRQARGRLGWDPGSMSLRCPAFLTLRVARGSASWLSSHGRGIGPKDALKDSQRLSRVAAGNPGFP